MTKQGVTVRNIDGEWHVCHDIGCPDFDEAARNRWHVAHPTEEELKWWAWYEGVIQGTAYGAPLPDDIPIGIIPMVGKGRQKAEL